MSNRILITKELRGGNLIFFSKYSELDKEFHYTFTVLAENFSEIMEADIVRRFKRQFASDISFEVKKKLEEELMFEIETSLTKIEIEGEIEK